MILVIDNYDSFTFNLVHLIGGLGYPIRVKRNDELSVEGVFALDPKVIVLSPGPCTPNETGIGLDLVKAATGQRRDGKVYPTTPLFGVCLGMQTLAQSLGGQIKPAKCLMHGKTSHIRHNGKDLFKGIPQDFKATRYHSLAVGAESLPEELEITATTGDLSDSKADVEVMAICHSQKPMAGVQFHPESIASEYGAAVFSNFLTWAGVK